jgi:two-component sensor histidine kinase
MALALHELATNAVKYGALSTRNGLIAVSWNVRQDGEGRRHMNLLWSESGGPDVVRPTKTGFGTRLIARTFGQESGGSARIEYRPEGLCCIMELTLSAAEEAQMLNLREG